MPVKIFFCYAHEDEELLKKLKTHLRPLQREGHIDVWYDRDIRAGTEWEREISEQLNAAQIILLLVSPDFMDSDYCYGKEMKRAIERHEREEAFVIPVILRYVYWQGVLGKFQALPKDGLPATDPDWHNIDKALYNVTEGIRKVIEKLITQSYVNSAISDDDKLNNHLRPQDGRNEGVPPQPKFEDIADKDELLPIPDQPTSLTPSNARTPQPDFKIEDLEIEDLDLGDEDELLPVPIPDQPVRVPPSTSETTRPSGGKPEQSSTIPQPSRIDDDPFAYMEDIQPIALPVQRASTFIHDIDQDIPDISDLPDDPFAYMEDIQPIALPVQRASTYLHDIDQDIPDISDLPIDVHEVQVEDLGDEDNLLPPSIPVLDYSKPPPDTKGTKEKEIYHVDRDDVYFTKRPSSAQRYQPSAPPRHQGQGDQPNFILIPQDRNNGKVGCKMSLTSTFGVVFIILSLSLFIFDITTHSLTLIASLVSILAFVSGFALLLKPRNVNR